MTMTDDQVRAIRAALMLEHEALLYRVGINTSDPEAMVYAEDGKPVRKVKDITSPNRQAADMLVALLQARADAAAAQSLMIERAAGIAHECWAAYMTSADRAFEMDDEGAQETSKRLSVKAEAADAIWKAIRALAPDAGTAELARLRQNAEATNGVWQANLRLITERDRLTASLAQANLRAKNAYMRGLLDSAQHLRSTIPDKPDGWEQIESMAQMLDALATREAAKAVAG